MAPLHAMRLAHAAFELHGQMYPHMVKGYCIDAKNALIEAISLLESMPSAAPGQCQTCGEFSESARKLQDAKRKYDE